MGCKLKQTNKSCVYFTYTLCKTLHSTHYFCLQHDMHLGSKSLCFCSLTTAFALFQKTTISFAAVDLHLASYIFPWQKYFLIWIQQKTVCRDRKKKYINSCSWYSKNSLNTVNQNNFLQTGNVEGYWKQFSFSHSISLLTSTLQPSAINSAQIYFAQVFM